VITRWAVHDMTYPIDRLGHEFHDLLTFKMWYLARMEGTWRPPLHPLKMIPVSMGSSIGGWGSFVAIVCPRPPPRILGEVDIIVTSIVTQSATAI